MLIFSQLNYIAPPKTGMNLCQNALRMTRNGLIMEQNALGMTQNGLILEQNALGMEQNGLITEQNALGMEQNALIPGRNALGITWNGIGLEWFKRLLLKDLLDFWQNQAIRRPHLWHCGNRSNE
jgi:hypothetical protein